MKALAILLIVLTPLCVVAFVAGHDHAAADRAEVAVAALQMDFDNLKSEKAAADALAMSAKAAADESQQSHEEDNAKYLDDLKSRANQAVDHLEETIASLRNPQDHSILTEVEQRQKFEADYPMVAKIVFEPKSCPAPEVTKTEFDELKQEFKAWRDRAATPKKTAALRDSVAEAKQAAADQGKQVLFLFMQDDDQCPACKGLAHGALADHGCMEAIGEKYVVCQVNITQRPDLRARFSVARTPSGMIFDPKANTYGEAFIVPSSVPVLMHKLLGVDTEGRFRKQR